jgi:hypothetical protein
MKSPEPFANHTAAREERWQLGATCTAGLLAMLAGIIALLGEQQATLAIRSQIHATSGWSHYQAKSIRKNIVQSRLELLEEVQRPAPDALVKRLAEYDRDKDELATEAWNSQAETQRRIHVHDVLSVGLTLFHVAIALVTISLMTRKRLFWVASLLFGIAGCFQLILGVLLP